MGELRISAISEAVGLRRETSVEPAHLPIWLARLHRALPVGDQVKFSISNQRDLPLPLDTILDGAGFGTDNGTLVRLETLPDVVAPGMRLLICGLNPSPYAAETGVPFGRAGNRFWPAALASGIVTADRDPYGALSDHRVGFTDLVKRTTRRANEVTTTEFASGVTRLSQVVNWLAPKAIVMVGLGGWRAGRDRQATSGWQRKGLAGVPVYLMPNTSGLNAHETLDTLTEHLRTAVRGCPTPDTRV